MPFPVFFADHQQRVEWCRGFPVAIRNAKRYIDTN